MNKTQFVAEPEWSGTETTFQGAPKWISQAKYNLMKRLTELSAQPIVPYGQDPEQLAELDKLNKELENLDRIEADYEQETQIPFAITPTSEPVAFTPAQLHRAATDSKFATQLFAQGAGINPLPGDVEQFQQRIQTQIPDLPQRVQRQYDVTKEAKKHFDAENGQEQARYYNEMSAYHRKLADREGAAKVAPLIKELRDNYLDWSKNPHENREGAHNKLRNETASQIRQHYPKLLKNFIELKNPGQDPIKYFNALEGAYKSASDDLANEPSKPRAANIKQWQPEDTDETLLNRAQVPLKRDEINDRFARIAPLTPLHDAAERLMQRNIGNEKESFNVAKNEIDKATGRNISGAAQRYVNAATAPTYNQIAPYMNDYNRNVIEALRGEAKKNFLEEVLPNITGNFASAGAFHSGARRNEINKFAQKTNETLNRDIAKLLHQGHSEAHTRAGEHNDRNMSAAQVMGQAQKAHQEGDIRTAEAARSHGLAAKQAAAFDAQSLGEYGALRQKHRQNQITDKINLHHEHQVEPLKRLNTESHIMSAHPITDQMTVTSKPQASPTPPNAANVIGGVLGQMAGIHRDRPHGFKKGGSVKNKYAQGGVVQRFNEMTSQLPPQKYDQQNEQIGNELRDYRVDPMQNWLQHVSAQMLANNRGDPLANMGKGAQIAEEHMNHHRDRMIDSRAKAANLYDAINRSRLTQHQLLTNFADKEASRAEQKRHHAAVEAYNTAKLRQKMNAGTSEKDRLAMELTQARIDELKQKTGANPSEKDQLDLEHKRAQLDELKGKKKLTNKEKQDIYDRINANLSVIHGMDDVWKDIQGTTTGPWAGWLAKKIGSSTADKIGVKSGKIALDIQKGAKNMPRALAIQNMIRDTKQDVTHDLETNRDIKNVYKSEGLQGAQGDIYTLLDNDVPREEIEKRFGFAIDDSGKIQVDEDGTPIKPSVGDASPSKKTSASAPSTKLSHISSEDLERIANQTSWTQDEMQDIAGQYGLNKKRR